MAPEYYTIEHMISMIDEPNGAACARLLAAHRQLFQEAWGSTTNHQAWPGGYFDHIQEIMNIAVLLHDRLSEARPLPFSRSDLLLVVYLHDLEKPWKYILDESGVRHHRPGLQTKEEHQRFRTEKLREFGIVLSAEHENGLKYAEGELHDYTNRRRVMGPLAAAAHMCDVASARLWFDHPMAEGDPWVGAGRVRDA